MYQDLINNREEAQNVLNPSFIQTSNLGDRVLDDRKPVLMLLDLEPPTTCNGCTLNFMMYIANSISNTNIH